MTIAEIMTETFGEAYFAWARTGERGIGLGGSRRYLDLGLKLSIARQRSPDFGRPSAAPGLCPCNYSLVFKPMSSELPFLALRSLPKTVQDSSHVLPPTFFPSPDRGVYDFILCDIGDERRIFVLYQWETPHCQSHERWLWQYPSGKQPGPV